MMILDSGLTFGATLYTLTAVMNCGGVAHKRSFNYASNYFIVLHSASEMTYIVSRGALNSTNS